MEINEISKAEFNACGGSRGKWDSEGINAFAIEMSEKYKNKVIGMPLESVSKDGKKIEGFWNKYYNGTRKIKYIGYYCRKRLVEAFETLNISADVRTAKNQLLIQFRSE